MTIGLLFSPLQSTGRGKFGVGNIFVKPDLRLKSISV